MYSPDTKKTIIAVAFCGVVSFFIYSCSGEVQSAKGLAITPLGTPSQGSQAASTNVVSIQAGIAVSDTMVSLGEIAAGNGLGISKPMNPLTKGNKNYQKILALSKKVAQTSILKKIGRSMKTSSAPQDISSTDNPCTDGGTLDISGTFDSTTGVYELDLTFTDCRENSSQINGPFHLSGTKNMNGNIGTASMTLTFGSDSADFSVQVYGQVPGNSYAGLQGVIKTSMTLSEDLRTTSSTAGTMTLAADGNISFNDFINLTQITLQGFTNEVIYDQATGRFDEKLNGTMTETKSIGGNTTVISTFTDVVTSVTETVAGSTITDEVAYSGKVNIFLTPDNDCKTLGTFILSTPTPIVTINGSCPVAGRVVINETALIQFNSDKSVDISIDGGSATHYSDCTDIFGLCEMDDLEDNSTIVPVQIGDTVSVSGENVLVTLTWDDDVVDQSDLDLHVGYYSDPSPATGPADTYVAWHNKDSRFGSANAKLDIDDVNGQGPEHVTILGMPTGRYVIAVNSFSLHGSASATANVSIKIGDIVYLYPSYTFTTADGDDVDPNSWYRMADLQCTSSGCSLVPPDPNLQVHDTAGTFKPGMRRAK